MVATHLFSHHGYEATSIRDLADAAGVTKPVLYYYFQSKENLFITLIHEAYEFFYQALEIIILGEGTFHERLRNLTEMYFSLSREYGDSVRLIYMTAFGPRRILPPVDIFELEKKHFSYLERLFEEGIAKGHIRTVSVDSITHLYLGSISIYMQTLLFTPEPIPDNVVDIILDLVFHGIGGEKQ